MEEEFFLLLNIYIQLFCQWTNRKYEHSQLLDDDDGVEEKEGGWVAGGQWWWWPREEEEEEEIVDACCLPVNSTGMGRANASFTLGNWPRDLEKKTWWRCSHTINTHCFSRICSGIFER